MKQRAVKNYFPLPNEVFAMGLRSGEIAVYGFLLRCEDRKTFQCHPSYATIGRAIGASKNSVAKYVRGLEAKGLITAERTTLERPDGSLRKGTLRYTIRPIREAVESYHARQLERAERAAAEQRLRERVEKYNRVNAQEPLGAVFEERRDT